ncbi:hypothetical protein ACVWY0_004454 [Arthrobacter sp. UYNi723]
MTATPCRCDLKLIMHQTLNGQAHQCQEPEAEAEAPAVTTEPPALNSDALLTNITAALGITNEL